jgi:tetratricopeptide (TPR) repeat protein
MLINNSPDDFFALKKGIEQNYHAFTLPQIVAYLRLSGWDYKIFLDSFPAIMAHLETASESQYEELFFVLRQIWDNYYPIGEQRDLPFYIGMLLYNIGYYAEALEYLEQSQQLYGDDASTIYNMGMCYYRLRQLQSALDCIDRSIELDREFEAAKGMRIKILGELKRRRRF